MNSEKVNAFEEAGELISSAIQELEATDRTILESSILIADGVTSSDSALS